jgi:hypothetical protein
MAVPDIGNRALYPETEGVLHDYSAANITELDRLPEKCLFNSLPLANR